jgi:hypothetical protein
LPGPQVDVVDRLFGSLNQEDTGFALARMKRGVPIARDAQEETATFFVSAGTKIVHPEIAFFETAIEERLPQDWSSIP